MDERQRRCGCCVAVDDAFAARCCWYQRRATPSPASATRQQEHRHGASLRFHETECAWSTGIWPLKTSNGLMTPAFRHRTATIGRPIGDAEVHTDRTLAAQRLLLFFFAVGSLKRATYVIRCRAAVQLTIVLWPTDCAVCNTAQFVSLLPRSHFVRSLFFC